MATVNLQEELIALAMKGIGYFYISAMSCLASVKSALQ
jgi:hypothetical protein